AVHMIAQGQVGHMVALHDGHMTAVPISNAVSQPKQVPLDSDLMRAAVGLNICLGEGAPLSWCRAEAEKAATRCAPPSADAVAGNSRQALGGTSTGAGWKSPATEASS